MFAADGQLITYVEVPTWFVWFIYTMTAVATAALIVSLLAAAYGLEQLWRWWRRPS